MYITFLCGSLSRWLWLYVFIYFISVCKLCYHRITWLLYCIFFGQKYKNRRWFYYVNKIVSPIKKHIFYVMCTFWPAQYKVDYTNRTEHVGSMRVIIVMVMQTILMDQLHVLLEPSIGLGPRMPPVARHGAKLFSLMFSVFWNNYKISKFIWRPDQKKLYQES